MTVFEEVFKLDTEAFPEVKHFSDGDSITANAVQWFSSELVQWSDGEPVEFSN